MPDAPETPDEPVTTQSPTRLETEKRPELKDDVVIQGGRRRGRRQIMKKKMVKDDEGYLGMFSGLHFNYMVWLNTSFSYCSRACVGVLLRK
jgi:DNA polymerase subunit Cdc27